MGRTGREEGLALVTAQRSRRRWRAARKALQAHHCRRHRNGAAPLLGQRFAKTSTLRGDSELSGLAEPSSAQDEQPMHVYTLRLTHDRIWGLSMRH
ncbi:hypothetical protein O3P69_001264 [Scylla paramamosain]|uniref:Uncharacterized protein n=1 Tax=Scylla paramamosain TaxID=85552 RepID=A0AAW0US85_SCYPA